MLIIDDFEIHRLTVPLGRVIGDNNCNYDVINVLAIALKTNQGQIGWGYGEAVWQGTFKNKAWYIRELQNKIHLEEAFKNNWWLKLKGKNSFELQDLRTSHVTGFPEIDAAVRLALWDLMSQEQSVPLYKLLNPNAQKNEALAYGSILDFPSQDQEALDLTKKFIDEGFKIIKVKIGADDVNTDIKRLKLIQSFVGSEVQITADANEAWDWQTALDRIEAYEKNGINLHYLEDPLNNTDLKGLKELTQRSPIPIIGHDYINNYDDLRKMVDMGGLNGIRTGKDIDYALKCIKLADEYNIQVYLGNSMFEVNAHLALAFNQVNRMEFSYLQTNDMIEQPIQFCNGFAQAPQQYGHGLYPKLSSLVEFSKEVLQ